MSETVYEKTNWDFTNFEVELTEEAFTKELESIKKDVDLFVSKKDMLTDDISSADFKELITLKKHLDKRLTIVGGYLDLKSSQNTQDETVQMFSRKYSDFSSTISTQLLFFRMWFNGLSQEKAYELAESLGTEQRQFKRMHDFGKYVLSEPEERILQLTAPDGAYALVTLYDKIVSKFSFDFDGDKLSLEQMRKKGLDSNRDVRRRASEAIRVKFDEHMHILGSIYQHVVKDYLTDSLTLRKYESPLAVRALREDITPVAVEALMDAAKESNELFQEFFALKAQYMKLDKLELYDLNAPVQLVESEKINYDAGMKQVLEAAALVSDDFVEKIKTLIDAKRIDATFHEYKRGGAYAYPTPPGILPFVFMQYLDTERDLETLAHELGHAIHFLHQYDCEYYESGYTLGIAESASTFMEEILIQKRLNEASKEKQIEILFSQILAAYQTIQRQVYISIFEKEAHALIGKGTTDSQLHELWTKLQKEQFGDSVTIDEQLISWAYIPHIYHSPFYCYNYGVGLMLSLLNKELFDTDKESFVKNYTDYLKAGATKGTVDTAKIMGIDLEDPATWKKGFDIIRQKLDKLKGLLAD